MLRALIIEDNPGARAELRELLSHHANITIIGEAPTVGRARTLLTLDDYDLVFLDIELRGGNGFDLVSHVRPEARIIFVTAFNDYAIRAFDVNALDYLLKPVDPDRLTQSLARLKTDPIEATSPSQDDDLIHLRTDAGSTFVSAPDITLVRSDQNYTHVHLADGTRHFIRRSLKSWEAQLAPTIVRRVARDALVNLRHVTRSTPLSDRSAELHVDGYGDPIAVTPTHWSSIKILLSRRS